MRSACAGSSRRRQRSSARKKRGGNRKLLREPMPSSTLHWDLVLRTEDRQQLNPPEQILAMATPQGSIPQPRSHRRRLPRLPRRLSKRRSKTQSSGPPKRSGTLMPLSRLFRPQPRHCTSMLEVPPTCPIFQNLHKKLRPLRFNHPPLAGTRHSAGEEVLTSASVVVGGLHSNAALQLCSRGGRLTGLRMSLRLRRFLSPTRQGNPWVGRHCLRTSSSNLFVRDLVLPSAQCPSSGRIFPKGCRCRLLTREFNLPKFLLAKPLLLAEVLLRRQIPTMILTLPHPARMLPARSGPTHLLVLLAGTRRLCLPLWLRLTRKARGYPVSRLSVAQGLCVAATVHPSESQEKSGTHPTRSSAFPMTSTSADLHRVLRNRRTQITTRSSARLAASPLQLMPMLVPKITTRMMMSPVLRRNSSTIRSSASLPLSTANRVPNRKKVFLASSPMKQQILPLVAKRWKASFPEPLSRTILRAQQALRTAPRVQRSQCTVHQALTSRITSANSAEAARNYLTSDRVAAPLMRRERVRSHKPPLIRSRKTYSCR